VSDTDSYDRNNSQLHPTKECTSEVNHWTRLTWVPQTTTHIDVLTVRTLLLHTPPGASAWWQHAGITNTRIQQFTGNKTGTWQNVAPHTYKGSTTNCFHIEFFTAIILLVETNPYYEQYLKTNFSSNWHHWIWNIYFPGNYYSNGTLCMRQPERLLVVTEIPYIIWQQNNDMWQVPTYSLIAPLSITMLLIIMTQNITKLWKLRHIYDTLKILCPFQTYDCGFRLNFKQYTPKQWIHFGINSYKLCSISKCMNDTDIYLGNSRGGVTANRTVSQANVRHGHKQYKNKFFHCLTYWTICQTGKSTAGGQYNLTERKWHRT
jgi:hypothetical protein